MPILSTSDRDALPDSAFGLPQHRACAMPDAARARNVQARAAEEFNAGRLSAADHARIIQKADGILALLAALCLRVVSEPA